MQASDPGGPRLDQGLDGQIYFIRYHFEDNTIQQSYTQGPDDLVSMQVYDQTAIPEQPTWNNCINKILPQYQKLYPIMGRFELGNYDSVVKNAQAIHTVLGKPVADALHMPVIRDLSILRTNAVLKWIENGTPFGCK